MTAPLVGRAAEMAALEAVAALGMRSDRAAAAVLIGAAGLGKTRLLDEIVDTIHADLRIRLVGYEPEQAVPLGAARPLLQAARPSNAVDLTDEPRTLSPTEPSPTSDLDGRWLEPIRLFEATHQAIRRVGRVVLTLDDVQWMDATSIALCHYLLRAAESDHVPLILVAAGRPSRSVRQVADSYARLIGGPGRFALLELQPLDRSAGVELLLALKPDVQAERAEELWAIAGGSPFWLTTISRSDVDDIQRSTAARLRRLDTDEATLLALLAVGARPFGDADLAEQLRWSLAQVAWTADRLLAAGLTTGASDGRQVAHDLIRGAVVRDIPDARRRDLHRMVAASLAARAGDDVGVLWSALEHRQAAGDAVLGLASRIVGSPGRRWLGADGLRDLAHIADEADLLDPRTIELERGLAMIAADLGDHATALERWARAMDRQADPIAQAQAALGAARAAHALGNASEAHAFLRRARSLADRPWVVISAMAIEAALNLWVEHRTAEGLATGHRAADAARAAISSGGLTSIDRDLLADAALAAFAAAFDGAMQAEDVAEMDRLADEMLQVARDVGPEAYVRALQYGAVAMTHLGRHREAGRRYREVWDRARHEALPILAVEGGTGASLALLRTGELRQAMELATEVEALYERLGRPKIHRIRPIRALRESALSGADWQEAVAAMERDIQEETDPHYRLSTHQLVAVWLSRVGRDAQADVVDRHLVAGRQDVEAAGCPRCGAEFELRAAEALARIGRSEAARNILQGTPPLAAVRPIELALRRWVGGLTAESTDDRIASLADALVSIQALDLRLEEVWVRIDLARAMEERDPAVAIEGFRTASKMATEMGALTEQRLSDQELRRLGERTWRRRASTARVQGAVSDVSTLSARESEIARAAAGGLSNPEIAAMLFLSRRTVEHHMSTILGKLELRNRTELAAVDALRSRAGPPSDSAD